MLACLLDGWRPGATIEVCHLRGEKIWQFGYLRSYVGMGVARAECVSGCKCPPREWNAHRPKAQVSQTAMSNLEASEDPDPAEARASLERAWRDAAA